MRLFYMCAVAAFALFAASLQILKGSDSIVYAAAPAKPENGLPRAIRPRPRPSDTLVPPGGRGQRATMLMLEDSALSRMQLDDVGEGAITLGESLGGPDVLQAPLARAQRTNASTAVDRKEVVPYVVVGVATTPKNTGHRSWIRPTWMTLPNVRSGESGRRKSRYFSDVCGDVHDVRMRIHVQVRRP